MSAKKKPSFWHFIDHVNTDIICGCETWLNASIGDSEVVLGNSPYNVYKKERADGYGGSLRLIKSGIISEPVDITTNCDIIFRKTECSNSHTLIIGSAYRSTDNDAEHTDEMVDVIRKECHKYKDAVIWIAGDLNFPDIDWTTNTIAGHQYRKLMNEAFLFLSVIEV